MIALDEKSEDHVITSDYSSSTWGHECLYQMSNPLNSCRDISVCTEVFEQPTDRLLLAMKVALN